MLEKVFAILAAVLVIVIAGLLVRRQNKYHETTKELSDKATYDLEAAVTEIESITNEQIIDYSLTHLENRMKTLNNRLYTVKYHPRQLERRSRHVKR